MALYDTLLNDWNDAYDLGRIAVIEGTGLESWQKFCEKKALSKESGRMFTWKDNTPGSECNNGTGREHFRYQIWRIPRKCPPTHDRIVQISYNVGQLGLPRPFLHDFIVIE